MKRMVTPFLLLMMMLPMANVQSETSVEKVTNEHLATTELSEQSYQKMAEDFQNQLNDDKIEPTLIYNNDEVPPIFNENGIDFITKFQLLDFHIVSRATKKGLILTINGHQIPIYQLKTINNMWGDDSHQTLDYADNVRQVKYYKEQGYLIFDVYMANCNGIGCGVSYQVIYDVKSHQTYAFGRFRLGQEPALYFNHDSKLLYFISFQFDGRNGGDDSTTYQIFALNQAKPQLLSQYYAKFTYPMETYIQDNTALIKFEKKWLKSFK